MKRRNPPCITVDTPRGRAVVPVEDAIRLYATGGRRRVSWLWPALATLILTGAALLWGAL